MAKYIGDKSGYAIKVSCEKRPTAGSFPSAIADASGTTNPDAYHATLGVLQVDKDAQWDRFFLLRNADFGCIDRRETWAAPGASYPPDGYTMAVGTWDTDATLVTTGNRTGSRALQLKATATATAIWSPLFPVEGNRPHRFGSYWQANGTTVNFTLEVFWYQDRDLTASATASSTVITKSASPANVSVLEYEHITAPADARYARFKIRKGTTTESVSIDRLIAEVTPSRFHVHKNGTDQGSVGTGETLITWGTASYNVGSDLDLTTELYTAPRPGLYQFGVGIQFNSVPDQESVVFYLKKNGSTWKVLGRHSASGTLSIQASTVVEGELAAGDTIGLYAQTTTASRTVEGDATHTYFWGREVLP